MSAPPHLDMDAVMKAAQNVAKPARPCAEVNTIIFTDRCFLLIK